MIISWTSDSPKDYLIRAGHLFKHKYKIVKTYHGILLNTLKNGNRKVREHDILKVIRITCLDFTLKLKVVFNTII